MFAIEFETDIKGKFIELQDYEKLINKHVRVIILAEDMPNVNGSKKTKIDELKELINKRKSFPKVDASIDIVKLCNEANSDIF